MQVGELWWFDNNAMHEAYNDGDTDRIHMIFDLLPSSRFADVYDDGDGTAAWSIVASAIFQTD